MPEVYAEHGCARAKQLFMCLIEAHYVTAQAAVDAIAVNFDGVTPAHAPGALGL